MPRQVIGEAVSEEHTELVTLCDVSGCENPAHLQWGDWQVCQEHFKAYLDGEYGLDVYFILKRSRELGIAADLSHLDDDIFRSVQDACTNAIAPPCFC